MEKIGIKYRSWFKGIAPKPIKLQIPGWAGENNYHGDGGKPQAWHCPPFVEASTYGLELIYPFETECRVYLKNDKLVYDGDWLKESKESGVKLPPFTSFAPGHFGFTSSLDIQAPPGHIIRIEPHPRFFTDQTGTVPCPVIGHIQSEWWPKIFFIVFKYPMPNQTLIFKHGEPYAQILVLPKKIKYEVKEMDEEEKLIRTKLDGKLDKYYKYFVNNNWTDNTGQSFNDRYKILSTVYAKGGPQAVSDYLDVVMEKVEQSKRPRQFGRKKVLGIKKNESIMQNQEEPENKADICDNDSARYQPSET